MKRFEDFTADDLAQLRSEIVLNSVFTSDYDNSFGISRDCVSAFFDGYYDYIWELAEESAEDGADLTHGFVVDNFDNTNTLWDWYNCFGDFDWVTYDE